MKKQARALVMYMTGTGNTAHAASAIARELVQAGWSTRLAELGRETAPAIIEEDLLVLGFPVLGFGMPGLVRRRLALTKGRGQPAAVFATWGGEGHAALWQGRRFLRRKGFRVISSGGATYPFQWTQVCPAPTGDAARHMVDSGEEAARRFGRQLAADLETGRPRRSGEGLRRFLGTLLSLLVSFLYSWIGRSGLGALYAADAGCRACGVCEANCPAEAIVLCGTGGARRPRWNGACQGCNRCINLCPRRAVQVSPVRAGVHLALNAAVIAAIVIGLNRAAGAAAALSVPGPIVVFGYIAALIALAVLGSRLQFAGLERPLFALESIPAVRRTIALSWTTRFPRYRCPGFRPSHGQKPLS